MALSWRTVILCVTSCVSCSQPQVAVSSDVAGQPLPALVLVQQGAEGGWSHYRLEGATRPVDLFVTRDDQPKPVVFLLHGSGCAPLMTVQPENTYRTTSIFQDAITPELMRVHFVMVEQQGVEPLRFSPSMTQEQKLEAFERTERECTTEFFENKTKNVRVDDALAAMEAVAMEPWARQIIVAGHSEGTDVTTGVLRREPSVEIAAAGLFASATPIRFWGGYVASGGGREAFQRRFDRIRMLQRADDDFMYEGLPARRWKTFWLDSTPMEDVRKSAVPLFVTHGTRDETILAPDLFVLEAIRQQPERALRYVVVEEGNHAFETPDGRWRIPELMNNFLDWAVDPNRVTAVEVLR